MDMLKASFWKRKEVILIAVILLVALGIRLYFGAVNEIPVWYDEGSYLTYAKEIGLGLDIDSGWNPRRPFLLPVLWGGLYFFGANEFVLRLTILIFSLIGVLFTYLLGKEMFSKRVGLLSAALMSFFWLHLFFTNRLLTDIPSMTFLLIGYYFFWRGYVKSHGNKFLYWSFAFISLAVFTRAALLLGIIPIAVYILLRERHKVVFSKRLWVGVFIFLLVLSPFIVWLFTNFENPVTSFTGVGEGRFSNKEFNPVSDVMRFVVQFPRYLQWPLLLAFLVGIVWLVIDTVLGIDQALKNERVQKGIFLLVWIAVFILFYGLGASVAEDRYLLPIFAGVFFICSDVLWKGLDAVKSVKKAAVIPLLVVFILLAGFYQLAHADMIISGRETSYLQVKEAGLWFKENSVPGDLIISQSKPQISYYGERPSESFPITRDGFEEALTEWEPRFVMVSVFEPHPDYTNQALQEHSDDLIPVHTITDQNQNPLVIIFEYRPE